MKQTIENLVFKGGGIKGIAYSGALKVLQSEGLLKDVKCVAGTSAGAIVAALYAIGCGPNELYEILKNTNFAKFEDGKCPLRVLTKYGLYKGDAFMSWLSGIFKSYKIDPDITFAEFKEHRFLDLYVFAVDLNMQKVMGFSIDRTPDTFVLEAIRASMSIPMYFKAWRFTNDNPNDHIFVDGGLVYNYPMSVFDNQMFLNEGEQFNPRTLGMYLTNLDKVNEVTEFNFNRPVKYIKNLFWSMLDGQIVNFKRHPEDLKRTIMINDYGISPVEFEITYTKKKWLVESGEHAAKEFVKTRKNA